MNSISTAEQFNNIISSDKEVIVKFTAGWCPDPIIEEYNQYTWYEVNRDELPEIAEQYDVMGIPSLLIYQNNEKKAHLHSANAKSPDQITDFLKSQKG